MIRNKRTLMLEYQLFTKCNLKCAYCYNYFDEGVRDLDFYKDQLGEIMKLYHDHVCFVINGGEPFLFKELAQLLDYVTDTGCMVSTYTSGSLPLRVYDRFLQGLKNKDHVFLTISVHFDEVLVNGKFTKEYLQSVERLASELPLLKLNVVVTKDYTYEKLARVRAALNQLHSSCPSVQYINFLIEDSLYEDPMKLARLCAAPEFKQFIEEIDSMFGYRNCMWDNCRTMSATMVGNIGQNALRLATGNSKFTLPVDVTKHELSFLVKGDKLVIETSMLDLDLTDVDTTDTHDALSIGTIPAVKLSSFIERNRDIVHSIVPKPIEHLREIGEL